MGSSEVIANLHWFPDTIRDRFGDGSALGIDLTYSYEDELLGTAGGVRNVAPFFGDEPFLVMAGDALTDIDLARPRGSAQRPTAASRPSRSSGSQNVERVRGRDRRRRRPDPGIPGEARPGRGALRPGELHDLHPRARDLRLLPRQARGRLRAATCSRRSRTTTCRSTSTRSTPTGTTSARSPSTSRATWTRLEGAVGVELRGDAARAHRGRGRRGGRRARRRAAACWPPRVASSTPAARLDGPLVIGDGAAVAAGACVKESVVLPGRAGARRARSSRAPSTGAAGLRSA